MKGLAILGSTGSIGLSTLDVVRRHPGKFRVVSLAAGSNAELLGEQVREFNPDFVSLTDERAAEALGETLSIEVGAGIDGTCRAAAFEGADMTVSAISGAAGLLPTLAAIEAGKDIALANKEVLVMAGAIVMERVRSKGVKILPVDSEHSAVYQSLVGHRACDVKRIILTASGGPFLKTTTEELSGVTPEDALNHPNWDMGVKVTVDSATLLNKGLEVIEARWLFDLPPEKISVTIHPQSVVHSLVEYVDGSVLSQLGSPDMRCPISYALSYPERAESGADALDLTAQALEFYEPDLEKFPCLALAFKALECGGTMAAVLNAADEIAVESFLSLRIPFTGISQTIGAVMEAHTVVADPSLEEIIEADRWARVMAWQIVEAGL